MQKIEEVKAMTSEEDLIEYIEEEFEQYFAEI